MLAGRVAVVTGAGRGIGRGVALELAAAGAKVVVNDYGVQLDGSTPSAGPAFDVAKEIVAAGGEAAGNAESVADFDGARRIVDMAIERFGRIDILVTCAGSSPGGLLENLTEDDWFSSLNLKFMGYVRTCRAVVPYMREAGSGSIVLVVGNDGLKPSYWEMTAGVANAADINFASSLAEQYGPFGIRVNTVNPGPVNTERWDGLEKAFARDKGIDQDAAHELAVGSLPLGRICEPEEVANLVAFLASPRASYLNGAHIPMDGGQRKALMDL
jgi:3-oxoacyl-[acyl-carrier protein] reductase